MKWTLEEEKYLKENIDKHSKAYIAHKLGRTMKSVDARMNKMSVTKGSNWWSEEEKQYLEENWGKHSISSIADKLGRTVNGVKLKAYKMGLGNFLESGDYITLHQFMMAIGQGKNETYLTMRLIRDGFPIHSKKRISTSVRIVYLEEFWKWAEKNQTKFDFADFKEGALGAEPAWAKVKRKNDIKKSQVNQSPWTKDEDDRLEYYLNQYKYSYMDLSKMLNRTCGAIQRRIIDLGIKARPIKADNHIKWTEEEFNILTDLIKERCSYAEMQGILGKSDKAIRGMVFRTYLTESLDKAAQMMKDGKFGDGRPPVPITHRLLNSKEKTQVKEDMTQFIGILKGLIKLHYDNDDYWQKDMCMHWNGYICTQEEECCDACTKFMRIQPQYCRRCGSTVISRKKIDICDSCKVARKKAYQKKYMALNGKKNLKNEYPKDIKVNAGN